MKFRVVSQPFGGSLGDLLLENLAIASKQSVKCTLVSAFAKKAGVIRLMPHIANAAKLGPPIKAIVGIDHKGTSQEAVQLLHGITDELYLFHSTRPDVTFHPKMYVFETEKTAAFYVGSCNLTAGGLFTNVEVFAEFKLDLPKDNATLKELEAVIAPLADSNQVTIVKVSSSNISALLSQLPTEAQIAAAISAKNQTSSTKKTIASLFGPGIFKQAPPVVASTSGALPTSQTSSQVALGTVPSLGTITGGWKRLSKHDVHPKQSPGQIVIPLVVATIFPKLGPKQTKPSGAKQSEVAVRVRYIDGGSTKIANGRFILYEPAPTHARSNIEHRFTFLDHSINPAALSAQDILIFETLAADAQGCRFNVYRSKPGSVEYSFLMSANSAGFGTLAP
jgi:HKD family nuclease